ncbi:hypothetical protein STEG23_002682, partial [Scotinomys teguina]
CGSKECMKGERILCVDFGPGPKISVYANILSPLFQTTPIAEYCKFQALGMMATQQVEQDIFSPPLWPQMKYLENKELGIKSRALNILASTLYYTMSNFLTYCDFVQRLPKLQGNDGVTVIVIVIINIITSIRRWAEFFVHGLVYSVKDLEFGFWIFPLGISFGSDHVIAVKRVACTPFQP